MCVRGASIFFLYFFLTEKGYNFTFTANWAPIQGAIAVEGSFELGWPLDSPTSENLLLTFSISSLSS